MKKAFSFFALGAALALASCETTTAVDTPPHTPRLSLNYTLSSRGPQKFFADRNPYVSTSQSILETTNLAGRADATVELRDASGQVVEQFRPRARAGYGVDSLRGYYVATRGYAGQPGRSYTLRASAPGVEAVEARLTMPALATIEDGRYVLDPTRNYSVNGRLSFSIPDNVATTDYYLAYARVLDAAGQPWGFVTQDYSGRSNDGLDIKLNRFDLSQPGSPYQTLPISDAGRNGQRLVFSNDVSLFYNGGNSAGGGASNVPLKPAFIEVTVSSIPADTYNYYQSIQRYNDTDGNPFAEPAPLRSNVPGGYGLFAGASDVVLRIPL